MDELGIRAPGDSALGRVVRRMTATRPASWVLARTLRHADRLVHWVTRGRTSVTGGLAGLPTIFLTTTGARTGRARVAQLIAVPLGDDLAVIGSNFGQGHHPGWVHNVAKDPHCTVNYRGNSVQAVARQLEGTEAEGVWATARDLYHAFAIYPELAGGRSIRVFALEPRSA